MTTENPVLKKLQYRDNGEAVLILNAPHSYDDVLQAFQGEVHKDIRTGANYPLVQVFGTSNEDIQTLARQAASVLAPGGLLWLCYPKKSSKLFKKLDCSRETVGVMLAAEGFEPVRQIAIDEDWSALRFKPVEEIKTLTRSFAATDKGKERTQQQA
ncbi:DUF3052 domain-containing protein [Paenibacillus sp. GCM10023252]|uniref:DUF3052 domain-containing protein n=1 Tax=Paenibacillus sp. GCM10023252 TaxID=3252649 RepID=UPI00360B75F5